MGWKELPSWLKGGIIALIVAIILLTFYFGLLHGTAGYCTLKKHNPIICSIQTVVLLIFGIVSLPVASILMPPKSGNFLWAISFIIYQCIILFIIGSLIGLIIGKIKSKKQI